MSSELGQGTRIDVELRLQVLEPIVESVRAIPLGSRQARRLQVLVVDDHAVNRQILHQQLSFLGHDVEEAENGLSALNLWHGQPFDMVITDCHMPLMSGSDLARSIRQEERENGEEPVVIIGLTADAQPEEIERCIQAGMNECLIKPIGLDVLEERLLALGFAADELPVTIDAEPVAIPTAPVSTTWIPACADRRRADDAQAAARRTADQQPQDLETLEDWCNARRPANWPSWRIGSRARRGWCVASNWWKAAGASRMPASARTPRSPGWKSAPLG